MLIELINTSYQWHGVSILLFCSVSISLGSAKCTNKACIVRVRIMHMQSRSKLDIVVVHIGIEIACIFQKERERVRDWDYEDDGT